MKLSINTRALSQREVVLTLIGEIDYASAQQLRTAIMTALANEIDTIAISLAGVTFVDSIGVGTLVVARRICNDLNVTLRVRDARPSVARLFAAIGVAEMLGLAETSAEPSSAGGVRPERLPHARVRPTVTHPSTTSHKQDHPTVPTSEQSPTVEGRGATEARTPIAC